MIKSILNSFKNKFKLGKIGQDTLKIYLFQFSSIAFGILSSIFIARELGPSEKGVVDIFNLLNSFITEIGLFGVGSGLLYYLVNKKEPLEKIHASAIFVSLFFGGLALLIGIIFLPYFNRLFDGLSNGFILISFCLSPVSYYRLIWGNMMMGINKIVETYKLGFYSSIIGLLILLVLWWNKNVNANNIIIVSIISSLVITIVNFLMIINKQKKLKFSLSLTKASIKYGFILYLGGLANIIHFKIDQLMINYWLGTESVAIYAVGVRWAESLFLLDSALSSAAFYQINTQEISDSLFLTKKIVKTQFSISIICGSLLALLAYPLVKYLYGDLYIESSLIIILLIPGVIFWSTSKVVSNFLNYTQSLPKFVTLIATIGMILNLVLNFLFLNFTNLGINAVAFASTFSYIFVALSIILKSFKAS